MIGERERKKTPCAVCERILDLSDGGPFLFELQTVRPRPVCPWCASTRAPELALVAAWYTQNIEAFNRNNPRVEIGVALLTGVPNDDAGA
jgi:hypothetical protein